MDVGIRELLNYIDVNTCDYEKWVSVGMAIHNEDSSPAGLALWEEWSGRDTRTDPRGEPMYKPHGVNSCSDKWKTFTAGSGYTMGTLVKYARDGGFKGPANAYPETPEDKPWGAGIIVNEHNAVAPQESPASQLIRYFTTMFEPDEYVGYVTDTAYVSQGRWVPDRGVYNRTAGDIAKAVRDNPNDLSSVIGKWHEDCGAWIRINPLDGKGVSDANVTDYRHALVESDSEPVEKQRAVYERLKLPIACLVESGGKSLHAIVRVDAKNADEYRERVNYIYAALEKEGLKPDRSDKNPARLSRLPGVTRKGVMQRLVGTDLGFSDFAEWKRFIETGKTVSHLRRPAASRAKMPDSPALIENVLLLGSKMLVTGLVKSGKSRLAVQLGLCIASGRPFRGHKTTKSKVLYVCPAETLKATERRVRTIKETLGFPSVRNFCVLVPATNVKTIDELAEEIIESYDDLGFETVIIDGVGSLLPGEETLTEIKNLEKRLDEIRTSLRCSVVAVQTEGRVASKLAEHADEILTLDGENIVRRSRNFGDAHI